MDRMRHLIARHLIIARHLKLCRPIAGAVLTLVGVLFLGNCSRTPEQREVTSMARGKAYLEKKDYKRAVIEFKVASQNMPKDAEPAYQLGMAYLSAGAVRQGLEALQKAVTLNPTHEGAGYPLALFGVGSSKPENVVDAKRVLTEYLNTHPNDVDALGALALAEAKLGNKPEALKLLEAAGEKSPTNMRAAGVVIALYAAKGDEDSVRAIARDLTERLPNSPDAAILRAQVSLAMHDLPDADAQISRALAIKRDFTPALGLRLRRELMDQDPVGAEQTTQELARLGEKRTWSAYARLLFAEKKIDQGMAEFNRVLKEHGDTQDLRDEYSALLISARRDREAQAIVSGTLAKDPKDKAALLQRTMIEIDLGNLDAAVKDVKTLQDLKALSGQLTYQQSRIFAARGETLRQGDLLAEAIRTDPRLLSARLELSRLLAASGHAKNALEILDQASVNEKRTAEYDFYRNMALMSAGDWDEARKGVDASLAKSPSAGFLNQDAMLRVRNHDLAGARKSLNIAFQLAPGDPTTLDLLGKVMKQQNEGGAYIAMVREAAAKNPGSALLQNSLGAQLEGIGDVRGARAAFEAARAAGDVGTAEAELALLDIRTGAIDQAQQRLRALVKTHDSAQARLMLADVETRKGASADIVVGHYLKALELEPANVIAMNNLANTLASRQAKYDDALFWAQKALGLAPSSPVVEDTIGWIYFRQARFDAAVPFLEKSLKDQERPLAHYHLAGALVGAGDPKRGRREYDVALKQDPKSDARASVSALFETAGKK
jgi:tetratricopeptide (TPR) repeat protein